MSEVIAVIDTTANNPNEQDSWQYPEGYDYLSRIEIKKRKDGLEVPYGVIALGGVERQFQMPDLAEMWGYDPKEWEQYKADPEKWDMKRQIRELTARVGYLETRQAELEKQLEAKKDPEPITEPEPQPDPEPSPVPTDPVPAPPTTVIRPPEPQPTRRRVVKEEVWYNRRSSRLGGLALVAALATGAALLFAHSTSKEHHPKQPPAREAIIPNNGYATPAVLEANGYHLAYYNRPQGRQVTGVWLPKNVNLKGSPGNYQIVKNGTVLVKNAQWDSQGKLTRDNMNYLRRKFKYNVGWGNLKAGRLVTIVAKR